MSEIVLNNVTFKYPEGEKDIFKNFSLKIGDGVTTLVGQNGTGKSTLLLLSAGLVFPQSGDVTINGINTKELQDLNERQKLVSFIFQNMEFETDEPIGDLLSYVLESGFHADKDRKIIDELVDILELSKLINKTTQAISKGELQRVIIAFSLLYGSKILMMDEPIFALEEYMKYKVMKYLTNYCQSNEISLIYSAHEIDISKNFSDNIILFHKDKTVEYGKTDELFSVEKIEKVYDVPYSTLKQKENFFRESLEN